MKTQRNLHIFFASARWSKRRALTVRKRLRIARKFKRRSYFAFLSWLVRTLSGSQMAHCSVGFDGAVLDPGIRGNRFWPFKAYVLAYPTLICVFKVPVQHDVDLDRFRPGRKPVLPTVVRWLTRGWWPWTNDCVCVALDCLHQGGVAVPVPHRLVSPQQLHDWLKENRYERTEFQAPTPQTPTPDKENCRE